MHAKTTYTLTKDELEDAIKNYLQNKHDISVNECTVDVLVDKDYNIMEVVVSTESEYGVRLKEVFIYAI